MNISYDTLQAVFAFLHLQGKNASAPDKAVAKVLAKKIWEEVGTGSKLSGNPQLVAANLGRALRHPLPAKSKGGRNA